MAYDPLYGAAERFLLHPADSAGVITVAAINAANSNLEAHSACGPALGVSGCASRRSSSEQRQAESS
jgi:hypothetical protein